MGWGTDPLVTEAPAEAASPPPAPSGWGNDPLSAPVENTHAGGQERDRELLAPAPKRTQLEDLGQGVSQGGGEGMASMLGMPVDLINLMTAPNRHFLTQAAVHLGLMSPETAEELKKPIETGSSDYIWNYLQGYKASLGKDTSDPRTTLGKAAKTVTSFLPIAATAAATGGGGVAQIASRVPGALLKYGVIPGVTSETAGQLTKGTEAEPYARAAGAVAPMAAGAILSGVNRLMSPTRIAAHGVSEAEWRQAQAYLDEAASEGTRVSGTEALQRATGDATRVGDIERVVAQSPEGGPVIQRFYADRPQQVEGLAQRTFDKISPATIDPYEVAPRVQSAANATLQDADKARSAATRPSYTAAASDIVPADDMEKFLTRVDKMIAADRTGLVSPELVKLRDSLTQTPATKDAARVPITDIENLDTARKYFRDRVSLPEWSQDAIPKAVGARVGTLLQDLRSMMVSNSPDFARGTQIHQQLTETVNNPLARSPTGQLAVAEAFPKQAEILFNPNPMPRSEFAVGKAMRDVVRANPEAGAQMARMKLEQAFNEAAQLRAAGPNQMGGAGFNAIVAGNSQQAKNLQAVITALDDGPLKWNALKKSLSIMETMGHRPAVGSRTTFNTMIMDELKHRNAAAEVLAHAASPARWVRFAHDLYERVAFRGNTREWARAITSGNVADLRALASASPNSAKGQALLAAMLTQEGLNTAPKTGAPNDD